MKISWKLFMASISVVMLAALGGVFLIEKNNLKELANQNSQKSSAGEVAGVSSEDDDYLTQLAKSLSDKGMVLFGAYWSEDSKKQKDLFGDAAKYIDYVECDQSGANANSDECIARKIETYPTWVYNNTEYKGIKTLSDLAQIIEFDKK